MGRVGAVGLGLQVTGESLARLVVLAEPVLGAGQGDRVKIAVGLEEAAERLGLLGDVTEGPGAPGGVGAAELSAERRRH